MAMRVNKIVTYLRPEEAYTLVEFLDQLREVLMQTYGDDITTMLKEASQNYSLNDYREEDQPF
jgi:activator of HSP90 ATPase